MVPDAWGSFDGSQPLLLVASAVASFSMRTIAHCVIQKSSLRYFPTTVPATNNLPSELTLA
jgi:hypothetical protein